MNAAETLEVIKVLHAVGASHFKSQDFEIHLKPGAPSEHPISPGIVGASAPIPPQPSLQNEEATQRLKDLIKTVKMTPEQLADQIFPAGAMG